MLSVTKKQVVKACVYYLMLCWPYALLVHAAISKAVEDLCI